MASQYFVHLIKMKASFFFFPSVCTCAWVCVAELKREKCVLFWSSDVAPRYRLRQHRPLLSSFLFFSLRDLSCSVLSIPSDTVVIKEVAISLGTLVILGNIFEYHDPTILYLRFDSTFSMKLVEKTAPQRCSQFYLGFYTLSIFTIPKHLYGKHASTS